MDDFDVTDGMCCSRAKTDLIRFWEENKEVFDETVHPTIDKVIQRIKTAPCKDEKRRAEEMINSPKSRPEWKPFWTKLVNDWKTCERGSF